MNILNKILGKKKKEEGMIKLGTQLIARHIRDDKEVGKRIVKDKVVTNAFVALLTDALHTAMSINTFNQHDCGTGIIAESAADTALGTAWGGARVAGTQGEAAVNAYRTVATITFNAVRAITEHGVFNAATVGILMDRTVFAAINVVAGDRIEFTFDITFPAGG